MNKKKGLLVLAVVLLCGVGIAFAALSDSLKINGSASAIAADLSLEFDTEATVTPQVNPAGNTKITSAAPEYAADKKSVTLAVSGLQKTDDAVMIPLTIINKSDVAARINPATDITIEGEALTSNYEVTVPQISSDTIRAGETSVVSVVVKLVKPFTTAEAAAEAKTFTITITGNATDLSE